MALTLEGVFHQSLTMQIFTGLSTLLLIGVFFVIYKMVLSPLYKMTFYRKQGIPTYYFPVLGRYKHFWTSFKAHGDTLYLSKTQAKNNPQRFLCSNLAGSVTVVLNDPALIKEFYLNSENYIKDHIYVEFFRPLLGYGLITSEGNHWKTHRKILSNAFHFGFLKSILPSIQATARKNLYDLRHTSLEKVNIMDTYQGITGEVVGKIFFGEHLNQHKFYNKPLTAALADLMAQVGVFNLSLERYMLGNWIIKKEIFPKHKKMFGKVREFKALCQSIIEERKQLKANQVEEAEKTKDMLDLLLEYSGEEGKMKNEDIIDQFMTFFLAGMDTTGHLVTMATYYLENPELKNRVMEEIRQHYSLEKPLLIEDLNKLEFTMAFLKETLRMGTPVPGVFPRLALKDHNLLDIKIRKGDNIDIDYYYNNFNPDYFQEAEKFNPMRWLDKSKAVDAYAFTPFSAGPRNCIGQHLALIEARVILAELLLMYDTHIPKDYTARMTFTLLYEPEVPILANFTLKATS